MRKYMAIGLILLAGCQNVAGPFAPRSGPPVLDPHVSLDEQKARARDQLALPDDWSGMPRSGATVQGTGPGVR
jgi:hypothetical protein